jgi:hypothetical protein
MLEEGNTGGRPSVLTLPVPAETTAIRYLDGEAVPLPERSGARTVPLPRPGLLEIERGGGTKEIVAANWNDERESSLPPPPLQLGGEVSRFANQGEGVRRVMPLAPYLAAGCLGLFLLEGLASGWLLRRTRLRKS